MISSNLFKLFEYCLLPIIKNYVNLSSFQFSYRENTSTLLATALHKECINKFRNNGSSVYVSYIDFSKAFDRVNHHILYEKLRNSNIPRNIILIFNSNDY